MAYIMTERKKSIILWALCIAILAVIIVFTFINIKEFIPTKYVSERVKADVLKEPEGSYMVQPAKRYDQLFIPFIVVGEGVAHIKVDIVSEKGSYHFQETYEATIEDDNDPDILSKCQDILVDGVDGNNLELTISKIGGDENNKVLISVDSYDNQKIAFWTECKTNIGYVVFWSVGIVLLICAVVVFFMMINSNIKIHDVYTLIAIPLSIVFLILIPVNCSNDSTTHVVFIIEQVNKLTGHVENNREYYTDMPKGDAFIINNVLYDCNQSFAQPCIKMYSENLEYMNRVEQGNGIETVGWHISGGYNNFVEYLPYIPFFLFGRLVGANLLVIVLLARLCGVCVYILIIRYAIKVCPYGKIALLIYGLSPMMMQEMTSINYDVFVNLGMLMGIVLLAKGVNSNFNISKKERILFLIVIFCVASAKTGVYLPLLDIMILFTFISYKEGRAFIRNNIAYTMVVVAVSIGALVLFDFGIFFGTTEVIKTESTSAVALKEQPLYWIQNIFNNFINDSGRLLNELFGEKLGWNEKVLSGWNIFATICLFIVAFLQEEEKKEKNNIVALCLSLIPFALIIYHLMWGEDYSGTNHIIGVQGRYFIPWVFALICFVKPNKIKSYFKNESLIPITYFVMSLNVISMLNKYIVR